jgi:hypothetical protein
MRTQRQVVDYSLQRRALLREVYAGRVGTSEVCDASPYLLSAARFHGDPTEVRCPICRRENVTNVHYIYGDELKQSAGQARTRVELVALSHAVREVRVYVVEVCRGCHWNHLTEQFLIGRAGVDPAPVEVEPLAVGGTAAASRGGAQVAGVGRGTPGSAHRVTPLRPAPGRQAGSGRARGRREVAE